jgi:BlaI family transcriptional regulator, penicillinase repressor
MQQRLTKAEEEIMQHIWRLGRCTVSDILNDIETAGEARPPHSSISSIVRILETKNFVGHKAYGKTHEYFPLVEKSTYGRGSLSRLISDYFDGSVTSLVSHLAKDEQLDPDELRELLEKLDGKTN